MKPKPLSSLNHFTVPVAIFVPPPGYVHCETRRVLEGNDSGNAGHCFRPSGCSTRGTRVAPAAAAVPLADRVAVAVDHQPQSAELVDVVAQDRARLVVLVVVERVAGVCHLQPAVAAPGGAEQALRGAGTGARLALGQHGRPGHRAVAVAAALGALLPVEQVEGLAAAVGDHAAEL